tara:strand:- start:65 stop:628 length:564 start_codon:yes stop_codon:yes gene_type:complete
MDFEGNVKILQENADVGALADFCNGLTIEQWDVWPDRQNNLFTHRNTKTFPLVWSSLGSTSLPTVLMNVDSLAVKLVQPFIAFLENFYSATVYKAMLTLLPKGGKIPPHTDSGKGLLTIHRCHLVVTAETGVDFTVGNETNFFTPGTLFEFNNTRKHSVTNNSSADRVHLIVDMLPLNVEDGKGALA